MIELITFLIFACQEKWGLPFRSRLAGFPKDGAQIIKIFHSRPDGHDQADVE